MERHIFIINNNYNNDVTDMITLIREDGKYVNGTTHYLFSVDDVVAMLVAQLKYRFHIKLCVIYTHIHVLTFRDTCHNLLT